MFSYDKIKESADYIIGKIRVVPKVAVILGTGLSNLIGNIDEPIEIPYKDIPNFPVTTVEGHLGKLIFGKMKDKYIIVMSGRFHYYEGYSMEECGFPIAVLKQVGVETLIQTGAVGGINEDLMPGDLVCLCDHIKLCADSPLRGNNVSELGVRYPDMCKAYDEGLMDTAKEIAYGIGLSLREAVYGYMTGPSFETPAEIRALTVLGADVVGMSTVPESLVAAFCGMKLLGLYWISNYAAGVSSESIELQEFKLDNFERLIRMVIDSI